MAQVIAAPGNAPRVPVHVWAGGAARRGACAARAHRGAAVRRRATWRHARPPRRAWRGGGHRLRHGRRAGAVRAGRRPRVWGRGGPARVPARALGRQDLQRILGGLVRPIPVGDAVRAGRARRSPKSSSPRRSRPARSSTRASGSPVATSARSAAATTSSSSTATWRGDSGSSSIPAHAGSVGCGAHHLKAAEVAGLGDIPGVAVASAPGRSCLADMRLGARLRGCQSGGPPRGGVAVVSEVPGATPDAPAASTFTTTSSRGAALGTTVWVHRKGAIAAPAGARVPIPGSMGTASYLAEGLGEATSLRSASHGAGRVMTRREARERIAVDRLLAAMRRVVHDERRAGRSSRRRPRHIGTSPRCSRTRPTSYDRSAARAPCRPQGVTAAQGSGAPPPEP